MKLKEYAKLHNLKTPEDWQNFFKRNWKNKKLPVAMYSCQVCQEIIFDVSKGCPICGANRKLKRQEDIYGQ